MLKVSQVGLIFQDGVNSRRLLQNANDLEEAQPRGHTLPNSIETFRVHTFSGSTAYTFSLALRLEFISFSFTSCHYFISCMLQIGILKGYLCGSYGIRRVHNLFRVFIY